MVCNKKNGFVQALNLAVDLTCFQSKVSPSLPEAAGNCLKDKSENLNI